MSTVESIRKTSIGSSGSQSVSLVQTSAFEHIKALDGLRGLACLSVINGHIGQPIPGLCILLPGVPTFFVLSGFLITSLVATLRDSATTWRAARPMLDFYVKRSARILPLYWTLLTIWFVSHLVADGNGTALPAFFFYQNLVGEGEAASPQMPIWSLCVEEQFYCVWPLVLWIATPRFAGVFLFAAVIAGLAWTINACAWGADQNAGSDTMWFLSYYSTLPHVAELAIGGLLALAFRSPETARWKLFVIAGLSGVAMLTVPMVVRHQWGTAQQFQFLIDAIQRTTLATTIFCVALYHGYSPGWQPIRAVLTDGLFCWIGKVSYCAYLIHLYVIDWLGARDDSSIFRWRQIACVAIVFGISWCSFRFFENPIRSRARALRWA